MSFPRCSYHYKCIRPLLQMHHPGFSCPLCRTFADLDADVEEDDELFGQPDGGDSNSSEEDSASPSAAMATQAADTTHSLEDDPLDTVAFPSTRSRSSSIHSRRPHGSTNRISSSADAPDAGDFQADMRRSSLSVAGPHGHAAALGHITVTGRSSRPGSVRNLDTGAQTPGSERRSLHHLPSMDELPLFQNPQHGHNGDDSLNRDHSPRDSGETASQPTASDDNLLSRVPTCVERRHNGTATDVNAMEQESSQEAGQQQQ